MRIPAFTPEQKKHEASRAFCEEMYQAFLDDRRIEVPVTHDTWVRVQAQVSANTRHFWNGRGFRIRTKSNKGKTVLFVWLENQPSLKRQRAA